MEIGLAEMFCTNFGMWFEVFWGLLSLFDLFVSSAWAPYLASHGILTKYNQTP